MNIHLNLIFLGYSIKTIFGVEMNDLRCIYALLCNKLVGTSAASIDSIFPQWQTRLAWPNPRSTKRGVPENLLNAHNQAAHYDLWRDYNR